MATGHAPRPEQRFADGSLMLRVERAWNADAEDAWHRRREPWVPSSVCPLLPAEGPGGPCALPVAMMMSPGSRRRARKKERGASPGAPPARKSKGKKGTAGHDMLEQLEYLKRAAAASKWAGAPDGVMPDTQWDKYLRRMPEEPVQGAVVASVRTARERSSKVARAKRLLREEQIARALQEEQARARVDIGRTAATKRVAEFRATHTPAVLNTTSQRAASTTSPYAAGLSPALSALSPPGRAATPALGHPAGWGARPKPATAGPRPKPRGPADLAADPSYAPFLAAKRGGKKSRPTAPPAVSFGGPATQTALEEDEAAARRRIEGQAAAAANQLANVGATGTAGYLHEVGLGESTLPRAEAPHDVSL